MYIVCVTSCVLKADTEANVMRCILRIHYSNTCINDLGFLERKLTSVTSAAPDPGTGRVEI